MKLHLFTFFSLITRDSLDVTNTDRRTWMVLQDF